MTTLTIAAVRDEETGKYLGEVLEAGKRFVTVGLHATPQLALDAADRERDNWLAVMGEPPLRQQPAPVKRVPQNRGYGVFCTCGAEMWANRGVFSCERGHKWRCRVTEEEYTDPVLKRVLTTSVPHWVEVEA